jgi:hypothetical protein
MEASFDGVRRVLARGYNDLARTIAQMEEHNEDPGLIDDLRGDLAVIHAAVATLICMYDPKSQPEDFNMLADEIALEPPYPAEDGE